MLKVISFFYSYHWTPLVFLLISQSHWMFISPFRNAVETASGEFTLRCIWMCYAWVPKYICIYSSTLKKETGDCLGSGAKEPLIKLSSAEGWCEFFRSKLKKMFCGTRSRSFRDLAKVSSEQQRPFTQYKKPAYQYLTPHLTHLHLLIINTH